MKRIKTLLRILKLILEIILWIPICLFLYLITLIFKSFESVWKNCKRENNI